MKSTAAKQGGEQHLKKKHINRAIPFPKIKFFTYY